MNYSFIGNKEKIVLSGEENINSSFKDLGAVCDAIRYKNPSQALEIIDLVIKMQMPILYRKNNKNMGSRHELHGRKGRYPRRAAAIVRKVIINAVANAKNKGYSEDNMVILHACANKTIINKRGPSKGILGLGKVVGHGYGFQPMRKMNLELAKVEIGISDKEYALEYSAKSGKLTNKFVKNYERDLKLKKLTKPESKIDTSKTKKAKENKEQKGVKTTLQPAPEKAKEAAIENKQ